MSTRALIAASLTVVFAGIALARPPAALAAIPRQLPIARATIRPEMTPGPIATPATDFANPLHRHRMAMPNSVVVPGDLSF